MREMLEPRPGGASRPRNETRSIVAFQCLRFIVGRISSWLYRPSRISQVRCFFLSWKSRTRMREIFTTRSKARSSKLRGTDLQFPESDDPRLRTREHTPTWKILQVLHPSDIKQIFFRTTVLNCSSLTMHATCRGVPHEGQSRDLRGRKGEIGGGQERTETADVALSKPNGQNGQPPSVMAQ